MSWFRFFAFGVLSFFFLYIATIGASAYHEDVHKVINMYHGCDSKVEIGAFNASTRIVGPCPRYAETLEYHIQNEIVGYNINMVMWYLWVFLNTIILYVEFRSDD